MGAPALYFDQVAAIYQHYTVMKARMKVTIVPNTVDAYVSGILIDDDLTPAITTLDGMVEQPSAVFKTSQRDAEVVTIYKNWDVKSAFTTNPLANPNLQGRCGSESCGDSSLHYLQSTCRSNSSLDAV